MKKHLTILALLSTASVAMAQTAPPAPASKVGHGASMQGRTAQGMPTRPDPAMMAKRQLDRFDSNKDGKVSLKEFLVPATESFQKVDANKDGNLTTDEMIASQKRQMAEFEKMRAQHSMKQNGLAGMRPMTSANPAGGMMALPVAPAK